MKNEISVSIHVDTSEIDEAQEKIDKLIKSTKELNELTEKCPEADAKKIAKFIQAYQEAMVKELGMDDETIY